MFARAVNCQIVYSMRVSQSVMIIGNSSKIMMMKLSNSKKNTVMGSHHVMYHHGKL